MVSTLGLGNKAVDEFAPRTVDENGHNPRMRWTRSDVHDFVRLGKEGGPSVSPTSIGGSATERPPDAPNKFR